MKVKVLHISKMNGVSGSENHLLTLLSGLNKELFDVHLFILTETQYLSSLHDYAQTLKQNGILVTLRTMKRHIDFSVTRALREYMLRERIDIVHTHLIHADLYGTVAARLTKVPAIVSSRHNDDRFRRLKPMIWLNRLLGRWQTKIIVISDWVGAFLQTVERIPREKIVRIHYGLDPEAIANLADSSYVRQEFDIPENAPVVGTIGRLTEQKGQTFLLQAIREVHQDFPDVYLLFLGDGELRERLENQARELGIESKVIFAGYRQDALKLLSGFDLFVLPSLWEGFGLVLLEAMAMKKAIVASAISAIPESVIDGETGFLVPPEHAERLAEALSTLLKEPTLRHRFGMQGYMRLQEKFTVQHMLERTEALYTHLFSTP